MPPVLDLTSDAQVMIWMEGYVATYLERDLRELSQVESLVDFRKVMQGLSLRTGSILNQAGLATDCGLSHATAHRYVKLLEVSHIVSRLPAYHASRSKRLVKSPKIYFLDPGLAAFLAGYTRPGSLADARELGGFFETLVFLQLRAVSALMTPGAHISYWRTSTRCEVDFVIEHDRRVLPIEVKLSRRPTIGDAANLLAFLDEHPQAVRGVVIHGGDEVYALHSRVVAVPWWWVDR